MEKGTYKVQRTERRPRWVVLVKESVSRCGEGMIKLGPVGHFVLQPKNRSTLIRVFFK